MSAKAGAGAGYRMSRAEPQVAELPIWSALTQLSLGLLSRASRLRVGEGPQIPGGCYNIWPRVPHSLLSAIIIHPSHAIIMCCLHNFVHLLTLGL